MGELASVAKVHVIEGRPWKDALIRVLEPRSPYRPWHAADGIEPGNAVVAVLDTDPPSVLAGVGIVGDGGNVAAAMDGIDRFYLNGLLELGTLQMLADPTPTTTVTLHLRSAFQLPGIWTFDKPIFPCWTGTSVHYAPNIHTIMDSTTKDRG
jgi:hypothetical protein